jgi:predicted protein tyrosine phosphatase
MEFFVYSMYAIAAVPPHEEPHVIISIRTPGAPPVNVRRGRNTLAVLFMEFPDLDENYRTIRAIEPPRAKRYSDGELFTGAHAREILTFVNKHKSKIVSIIVQCEGGMSRSPAIAAALSKLMNGDDSRYFKDGRQPNMLVYDTMLKEAANDA